MNMLSRLKIYIDCKSSHENLTSHIYISARFSWRTSLAIGVTMAHVGEFAFVLLSASSQLNILPHQVIGMVIRYHFAHVVLRPPGSLVHSISQ